MDEASGLAIVADTPGDTPLGSALHYVSMLAD